VNEVAAQVGAVSGVNTDGVYRKAYGTVPEITYSRSYSVPEVSVRTNRQIARVESSQSPAVEQAAAGNTEGTEEESKTDIRALANEIYPLIRRMLMVERDRQPF
jgi:ABC-type uncharacterized transport system YnjBCD substrate-binding protein